jgi:murein DD-endopeptidase / murein LD-carboxypeptidase
MLVLVLCISACRHRKHEAARVSSKPAPKPSPVEKGKKSMPDEGVEDWYRSLGLSRRDVRESRLYSFIGEWYGTPYKYGGCVKSGVDCSCFAIMLNEKVYNRSLPRNAHDMYLAAEKFGVEDAREGDLLFFRINSKKITHVGVYLGKKLFVHSSSSLGVVVNSLNEAYYKKHFFCAGRMKGK